MAVAFTGLFYWLWGTTDQEKTKLTLNSSADLPSDFRELDSNRFTSRNGNNTRASPRRVKKWQSREERKLRIDREYDVVIVPSDGDCLSGSEFGGSDWSIGWMEPHTADFQSDDGDGDNSFAVLVPCYGRDDCYDKGNVKSHVLGAFTENVESSSENPDYVKRWLSSLQDI
ncbi:hypothetical protein HPP92_010914 [Vanilla planifolia]|uniref:Uncharacterized protein n=1 Tax=Vanilla planifolia TaxID=51239 RepID=A0A835QUR6_VANPL|nr:hypothetical protein HPP92_010909 [Vanilla planifolia]KAG0480056.1 hypothetical protein HPP92_010914 [Vanilla planifolia]